MRRETEEDGASADDSAASDKMWPECPVEESDDRGRKTRTDAGPGQSAALTMRSWRGHFIVAGPT